MSTDAQPNKLSLLTAEEILRLIYGDDLKGCTVSLEKVAGLIEYAAVQRETQTREVLSLYEKVVEAAKVLSTPPDISKVGSPEELQMLLSQRLDTIHTVMNKTIETTKSLGK